jgi:hypothetical protein
MWKTDFGEKISLAATERDDGMQLRRILEKQNLKTRPEAGFLIFLREIQRTTEAKKTVIVRHCQNFHLKRREMTAKNRC